VASDSPSLFITSMVIVCITNMFDLIGVVYFLISIRTSKKSNINILRKSLFQGYKPILLLSLLVLVITAIVQIFFNSPTGNDFANGMLGIYLISMVSYVIFVRRALLNRMLSR
jgi:uncharacterized membrane protein